MAIAILNELQQRLHTSAIAGVNLLDEDFRLKKTVSQFSEIAKASPVLDKISKMASKLCESDCENRSGLLLDTITLVDAVVCTQASYQPEGEELPICLLNGGVSEGKYSELAPLIEALSSKGSGRYEIIKRAYDEKSPVLRDFRLKPFLVEGLNDSYSELADLVVCILQQEGQEIVPLLKDGFDPKGKKDMVRRLKVIARVAGAAEMEFYHDLLQEGSAQIKEEAVTALGCSKENIPLMVQIAQTAKGGQKKAAEQVLSHFQTEETEAYWKTLSGKKLLSALPNTWYSISPALSDQIAEEMDQILTNILTKVGEHAGKDAFSSREEIIDQLTITNYLANKYSPRLLEVLKRWGEHEDLIQKPFSAINKPYRYQASSIAYLDQQLSASMLMRRDDDLIRAADQLDPDSYCGAVLTAKLIRQDSDAFDFAEPYLRKKDSAAKICAALNRIRYDTQRGQYLLFSSLNFQEYQEMTEQPDYLTAPIVLDKMLYLYDSYGVQYGVERLIGEKLDSRWISQLNPKEYHLKSLQQYRAIQLDNGEIHNVLMPEQYQFANPNDAEGTKILKERYRKRLLMNNVGIGYFYALVNLGETDFHDLVVQYLQKHALSHEIWTMLRYLPSDREQMTALIQELMELCVADKLKLDRYMQPAAVNNRLVQMLERLEQGVPVSAALA